jgi:hypothetical protein
LCVYSNVGMDVANVQIMCYMKFYYNNPMNPSNSKIKSMKGILLSYF